ncbi:MAG TPA: peroxiredoxin [Sphingobium sp.]
MTEARRPLLLIATTDDAERLRGGLTLACAEAALGGTVRVFLQLDAVAALRPPLFAPRDVAHAEQGLPTLAALVDDALDLGVTIIACQSGLALAGLTAEALDPRIEMGGPVGVLAIGDAEERLALI